MTKRKGSTVENDGYEAMMARCVRAFGRRVADGNLEDIGRMIRVRDMLDDALAEAVGTLHASGESWARIGGAIGMTRQAAQQRWGSAEFDQRVTKAKRAAS